LPEGVPKQVPADRVRVRYYVEGFVPRDPGEGAHYDIAHRITARLAGGEPPFREERHRLRNVPDADVVDVHVLPRGQMDGAPRCKPVGRIGERAQVGRRWAPERDPDAEKVTVRPPPDGIDSLDDPDPAEFLRRDGTGPDRLDRPCHLLDFRLNFHDPLPPGCP